jgi:hypothetical protein
VWVKSREKGMLLMFPPLEKEGEGDLKTLGEDREVLCNLDVVVEKIWSELGIIKSPLTPLCQRGEIG